MRLLMHQERVSITAARAKATAQMKADLTDSGHPCGKEIRAREAAMDPLAHNTIKQLWLVDARRGCAELAVSPVN
jgi:hypothetical protein